MIKPSISIVYVNYKTPILLSESIDSVRAHTIGCEYEIIVVDNHSQDDSEQIVLAKHADIKWINAGYNSGFARGNNLGINAAKFGYVLIINSDTFLKEDTISNCLIKFIELSSKEKIGLLGCKICSFEGAILPSVHPNFTGISQLVFANAFAIKFFKPKRKACPTDWFNTNHTAAHISGAFMIFNKRLLNKKDLLLDEDFFLYAEDVEWCYRLGKARFKHYFYSDATLFHKDAASSPNSHQRNNQILISNWLFIYKSFGYIYYMAYITLQVINIAIDNLLYKQLKNKSNFQQQQYEYRNELMTIIKKYAFKIPKKYNRNPSSSKAFLKYD